MHFSNDHAYVYAKVVVPVLILAVWLIVVCSNALVAYNTKEHWILSRNILLCTFAVLVFVVVCFFIPIPNHLFVRRQKIEDRLTLFAQGANSNIYEENGRLWKAMQTLPNYHSNSKIEIKCCNRKKDRTCTVPLIIFRKLHVSMMMISWQRIRMLQEKGDDIIRFFPYIYYIDTKRGVMQIEKIGAKIEKLELYRTQINELDGHLTRLGLVLEDVDADNVMVDSRGQLKVVDFDYVLTGQESKWMRSLGRILGTVQNAKSVLGANKVMQPMYPREASEGFPQ